MDFVVSGAQTPTKKRPVARGGSVQPSQPSQPKPTDDKMDYGSFMPLILLGVAVYFITKK